VRPAHRVRGERYARIHLNAALLVVSAGLFVGLAGFEWLWRALAAALV